MIPERSDGSDCCPTTNHLPSVSPPPCHAERSEASNAMDVEMLRCAQHDRGTQCCCAFHVYRVKSYSPSLFTTIQH